MGHTRFWAMTAALLGCTALVPGGAARAGSFELWEGTTDQMANAYAGQASKAYDAGTAWANPAGMVRIQGNEIDSTFNFIDPQFYFTGTNTDFPGEVQTHVKAINPALVPASFNVISLSPDLKFGLALKSPFGARIDYPTNWVGRFQSEISSLTDIAIEPSLAYAVTPQFSIGGGPVVDWLDARQTQDILPALGYQFGDIYGDARGQTWGLGYNASALYQIDAGTRFGISYRSRIEHRIDMKQTLTELPGLADSPYGKLISQLLAGANTRGRYYEVAFEKFNLPDNLDASFYHEFGPEWAVMAEAIWTHWQIFNNISVVTIGTGNGPTTSVFDFHNTIFGSAGASYRPLWMPNLLLQGGVGYDEDPVTDGTRTAQIPTESRVLIGFGFTYDLSKNLSFDLAYSHYFSSNSTVSSDGTTLSSRLQLPEGQLAGSYNDTIDSYSGGFKLRF